jgi:hypothetical protein
MPQLTYNFDSDLNAEEQARIKAFIENAFRTGEILACRCPAIEAWVYPTIKPDFQASFACACDAMRPLFSSTPETE